MRAHDLNRLVEEATARLDQYVAGDVEFEREFGKYVRLPGSRRYEVPNWLASISIKQIPGSSTGIFEAAWFVGNFAREDKVIVARVLQFAAQTLVDAQAPAGDATLGVFRLMIWRYLSKLGLCEGP